MKEPTNVSLLNEMIGKFNHVIQQQAQGLMHRTCTPQLDRLARDLAVFGVKQRPAVQLVQVWECPQEKLPPKLVVRLTIYGKGREFHHGFDVAIAKLHHHPKDEHIFELCMLRAEARHDLEGTRDGHALDRMLHLEKHRGL